MIDGRSCIVLSRRIKKAVHRVYLDAEREYLLLRYEMLFSGRAGVKVDAKYERTDPPVWVPSSWVASIGGERSENQVTEVELGIPVPDETFTIIYPPGAKVRVIGGAGPIARGDPSPPQQRFVADDDGALIPQRAVDAAAATAGQGWWSLTFTAAGAAVLGAVAFLWWRGRARAR